MAAIIAISLKKAITAGSVKNAAVIFLNLTLKDIIPAADIINKKKPQSTLKKEVQCGYSSAKIISIITFKLASEYEGYYQVKTSLFSISC